MATAEHPADASEALQHLAEFPLMEALFGRRSRRFALGDEIPDGPLAYKSKHEPLPLTELERALVLAAMGGTTGWHYGITRHARYAPHVANYPSAAAGRTFPSAAGFHTVELFFTDDSGTYFFPTRDAGALVDPATEEITPELMVERHLARIRRLSHDRIHLPAEEPYVEGHNTWCANVPGSLLVIPVADIAQMFLAILCFFAQNGYCIYDDVNDRRIPGIERFSGIVDVDEPFPLTFTEQYGLTEATAELATSCYAGVLTLQAMGLGGWMFDGIDRFTMLGASGDPEVPGLGFRYDEDDRWSTPNPTGLEGVFEAFCPPHYKDMAAAVETLAERKFGSRWPSQRGNSWRVERKRRDPGFRGAVQRRVQGVRLASGPICVRHVREGPGHGPERVPPELRAGAPPRSRLLRPLLQAGRLPGHPQGPHEPLARPDLTPRAYARFRMYWRLVLSLSACGEHDHRHRDRGQDQGSGNPATGEQQGFGHDEGDRECEGQRRDSVSVQGQASRQRLAHCFRMLAIERMVAGRPVAVSVVHQLRLHLGADLGRVGTAGMEAAGGRGVGGTRQIALEHERLARRVLLRVRDRQRGQQGQRVRVDRPVVDTPRRGRSRRSCPGT